MANKNFRVRQGLQTPLIADDAGTTAITLSGADITANGTLYLKGSSSGNVGLKGAAAAGSTTYTLPSADGTSGQVLSTNGSGTLSWATASGGGSPAGSNQQIQYNNSGAFGASSGLIYDGTSLKCSSGNVESQYSNGDEGGEFRLGKPQTNTTLAADVSIDIYQNRLRIFENGGSNRGAFLDLTKTTAGVTTNLAPLAISNSGTISAQPYSLGPGVLALGGTFATLSAGMAQTIRYQPIYVTETCTLSEVAFYVVTATTLASCSAMIYIENCSPNSSTGWQPTGHLSGGYCGEVANITTTGTKTITGLSITLQPGAYLIAIQISNYTGTLGLRYLTGQVFTGGGYVVDLASGTTTAQTSFGRSGITYVSGTPATVGDFTNTTPNNLSGQGYIVMTKFAKV